jgi:hypothetical protein
MSYDFFIDSDVVFVIELNSLINSSHCALSFFDCSDVKYEESLSNRIQYNVSRASLKLMYSLLRKSFLDCAADASSAFAPIEVPARRNCLNKSYS